MQIVSKVVQCVRKFDVGSYMDLVVFIATVAIMAFTFCVSASVIPVHRNVFMVLVIGCILPAGFKCLDFYADSGCEPQMKRWHWTTISCAIAVCVTFAVYGF